MKGSSGDEGDRQDSFADGQEWRGFPHNCMRPICSWPSLKASEDLANDEIHYRLQRILQMMKLQNGAESPAWLMRNCGKY
eukprot:scaffold44746_cov19-Tisochrysis_lutea.AAC.3